MGYYNKNKNLTKKAQNIICKHFKASKMTRVQLSNKSNVDYTSLLKYLCGWNDIRTGDFISICNALGIKVILAKMKNDDE